MKKQFDIEGVGRVTLEIERGVLEEELLAMQAIFGKTPIDEFDAIVQAFFHTIAGCCYVPELTELVIRLLSESVNSCADTCRDVITEAQRRRNTL